MCCVLFCCVLFMARRRFVVIEASGVGILNNHIRRSCTSEIVA